MAEVAGGGGPLVTVRGLTRRFRRRAETVTALDDVSIELYPGELTVAAGPSGSGKTTLLSILAGLESSDAGEVITHPPLPQGVPLEEIPWRHVAFVPQSLTMLDELTAAENIEMPALLDTKASRTRPEGADRGENVPPTWTTEYLMALLEISQLADRYPSMTSGGEQQRTAIGRALRLRPTLLLADEPTGHQDRGRVDLVLGVLRDHAYAGHTVLISSHDEAVISAADRVLTLADGRLIDDRRAHAQPSGYR
jgi:putative ABC transport system ATP-binding protein